jgi:hypothetical protein
MVKLSISQIKKMKHALGHDISLSSYRNYFCSHDSDPELDELVDVGIIMKTVRPHSQGGIYYHVTDRGIEMLKEIN